MLATFWDWIAHLPQSSASFLGSLTGSILGLLAILAGALFNAYLNRRRDDRLREQDRRSTATALHAELSAIRASMLNNVVKLRDDPPNQHSGFLTPDPSHAVRIFPEVISDLKLFDAATIDRLTVAYGLIEQFCQELLILGGTLRVDMPPDRHVVALDAQFAKFVAEMMMKRIEAFDEALAALSKNSK